MDTLDSQGLVDTGPLVGKTNTDLIQVVSDPPRSRGSSNLCARAQQPAPGSPLAPGLDTQTSAKAPSTLAAARQRLREAANAIGDPRSFRRRRLADLSFASHTRL